MFSALCHLPVLHSGDILRPPGSSWPTSQIRSSMDAPDDGIDYGSNDTFRKGWARDKSTCTPYQERTATNLYGRTPKESLAQFKWDPGSAANGTESLFGQNERSDKVKEAYPFFLYGNYLPSEQKPHVKGKTDAADAMLPSYIHNTYHTAVTDPTDVDAHSETPWPNIFQDVMMSDDADRSSGMGSSLSSLSSPLPPISAILSDSFDVGQKISPDVATELRGLSPESDDEGDIDKAGLLDGSDAPAFTSSGGYGTPNLQSKNKKKASPLHAHHCKQCNVSFTRNFDLLRHNQKHNKSESTQDTARRTCTNCGRILSRVDAARRHVDTMPDSCNYIRKKESKPLLPIESSAHYEALIAKYRKLADETKKPKGRKKAVVLAASA